MLIEYARALRITIIPRRRYIKPSIQITMQTYIHKQKPPPPPPPLIRKAEILTMAPAKDPQPTTALPVSRYAAYTIAYTRPLVGLSMLFPPTSVFRAITSSPQADVPLAFLSRLTGVREVALGGLLALALRTQQKSQKKETYHSEIRCIILANLLVDSVDLVTASIGYLSGNQKEQTATVYFAVGAMAFVLLELASLGGFAKNASRLQL